MIGDDRADAAGRRSGRPAAGWGTPGVTLALNRYKTLLGYTNSDAASLTWQDAAKLVADGKAAFNVMGDWQDGYFSGIDLKGQPRPEAGRGYGWAPVPGTDGVYDWLSDSFTLPKGAPHRAAAVQWLGFLGSRLAQDTFNPVKGSIPARKDANAKLYGPYLKSALKRLEDRRAGGLADARRRGAATPGTPTSTRRSVCSCRARTWRSSRRRSSRREEERDVGDEQARHRRANGRRHA